VEQKVWWKPLTPWLVHWNGEERGEESQYVNELMWGFQGEKGVPPNLDEVPLNSMKGIGVEWARVKRDGEECLWALKTTEQVPLDEPMLKRVAWARMKQDGEECLWTSKTMEQVLLD
jgi:hypothetical protein